MNQYETSYADDVELEDEGPGASFTARLVEAGIVNRNGRTLWQAGWEPRSYKLEFSRETYPFRNDDFMWDRITAVTPDGRTMGNTTLFGQVRVAFDKLGIKLTRNDQFRPLIEGKDYLVTRVREPYASRDSLNRTAQQLFGTSFDDLEQEDRRVVRSEAEKDKTSYAIVPEQIVENYVEPADRRVIRYGFKAAPPVAKATPFQIMALQKVLNGKTPSEYLTAIIESDDPEINTDLFHSEAANGDDLTQRMVDTGTMIFRNGLLLVVE